MFTKVGMKLKIAHVWRERNLFSSQKKGSGSGRLKKVVQSVSMRTTNTSEASENSTQFYLRREFKTKDDENS